MACITQFDLRAIAAYLPNPADVARVRAVCRDWRGWVEAPKVNDDGINVVIGYPQELLLTRAIELDSVELAKIAIARTYPIDHNNWFHLAFKHKRDDIAILMFKDSIRFHNNTNYDSYFKYAVAFGCIKMARFLIECGAKLFNDALLLACEYKNREGVKFALSLGATNIKNAFIEACSYSYRWTLYFGKIAAQPCMQVIELLLPLVNDVNTLNKGLEAACRSIDYRNGDSAIARALIDRGANAYDAALYISSMSDSTIEFTRFLLSLGATPGEWDRVYNNPKTLELMLNNGAIVSEALYMNALETFDLRPITALFSHSGVKYLPSIMEYIHETKTVPEGFEHLNGIIRLLIAHGEAYCPMCEGELSQHFR